MRAVSNLRRRRRTNWQLVACGFGGHVHAGADCSRLREQDAVFARELDGVRWHRCLRCDTWSALPTPAQPGREHPPDRDEIEIPLRGEALRAKIVLRLIAVDRAFHFLILSVLGVAVLVLEAHQKAARGDFERVLAALQSGVAGGPVQTTKHVGLIGELDKLLSLRAHTLTDVGIALLAYALLEGVEAVGLWLAKRWAEYLTFIATAILLPLEIYEIADRVSALKVIGFLINLVIVVYLVFAKRLFGLRGGGAADEALRRAENSWEALERSAPPRGAHA